MIEIRQSDRIFTDSPDAGPECLCSRCGKPITEDDGPPIRAWPENSNCEYRYHPVCLGAISA